MEPLLAGTNHLIVGGRTGIGRALLDRLAQSGAALWSVSRQPLNVQGRCDISSLEMDVTSPDLTPLRDFLPEQLHGLVYCPGSINLKPFPSLKDEDFLNDFEVNVLGLVRVLRECYDKLRGANGASVVMFSTVAVHVGMNYHASVAAAKGAVEGIALSLAAEWSSKKIRVNVVAPSLTDTPLAERLLPNDQRRQAAADRHPLKRIGTPEDMAQAAAFLLSPQSSWMTGQVLHMDGGLSRLRPL